MCVSVEAEGEGEAGEEAMVEGGDLMKVTSLEVRTKILWTVIHLISQARIQMMVAVWNRMSFRVKFAKVSLNLM